MEEGMGEWRKGGWKRRGGRVEERWEEGGGEMRVEEGMKGGGGEIGGLRRGLEGRGGK